MNRTIENGIWIRVADLAAQKRFYQAVFNLDPPEIETAGFCVFCFGDNGFFLVLEKSQAPYLEHGCSANSWFVTIDDIDRFECCLDEYKIQLFRNMIRFGGRMFHRCTDPEGNILVVGEKES